MKITKQQLKQIIKEELSETVADGPDGRSENEPTEIARILVGDGTIVGTEDERTRLVAIYNKAQALGRNVPIFPEEYTDFMQDALSAIKGFLGTPLK
jgi:hypothetical protein